MYIITPAYIAAARRDLNMASGPRLLLRGPCRYDSPCTLLGQIHLDLETAELQWHIDAQRPGVPRQRISGINPWPIMVTDAPPALSTVRSINNADQGGLEFPPDVCVWVARWLSTGNSLGTCASLNAISKQVQFATLPVLYRVLVWKSYSWETTNVHRSGTWDFGNMREHEIDYLK